MHCIPTMVKAGQRQRQRHKGKLVEMYIFRIEQCITFAHDIENQWKKSIFNFFLFNNSSTEALMCVQTQREKIKSMYRFLPSVSCQGLNCMHERMRLKILTTHHQLFFIWLDYGDGLATATSFIHRRTFEKEIIFVRCISQTMLIALCKIQLLSLIDFIYKNNHKISFLFFDSRKK